MRPLAELENDLIEGRTTSVELTELGLARIDDPNGEGSRAFVRVFHDAALAEASAIGIKNIVPHGEKPTAYMADGYARATNRPGVCMAQSVGAANGVGSESGSYGAPRCRHQRKTPL